MRTSMLVAVAAVVGLAGCGKQLNPAYCAQYGQNDPDCQNGGLVTVDAAPPCNVDTDCHDPTRMACDTDAHRCVQCFQTHVQGCPSGMTVCGTDDMCHGCITSADCGGNVCAGGMCEAASDIAYVSANAPTGNDCSTASHCTLHEAVALVNMGTKHAVELDDGDYHDGPYTITAGGTIVLYPTSGMGTGVKITLAGGMTGSIFTVTTVGTVLFQYLSMYGSNADGVTCTQGEVSLHGVQLYMNGGAGLHATACKVNLDRSTIHDNSTVGLQLDNATISIVNNFLYANGTGGGGGSSVGGAQLTGTTTGRFKFNTLAYNKARNGSGGTGGLDCQPNQAVDATSSIISGNDNTQFHANTNCTTTPVFAMAPPKNMFLSSTDLHLGTGAPTPAVVDNGAATCSDVAEDFDGEMRPKGTYCDLGADER